MESIDKLNREFINRYDNIVMSVIFTLTGRIISIVKKNPDMEVILPLLLDGIEKGIELAEFHGWGTIRDMFLTTDDYIVIFYPLAGGDAVHVVVAEKDEITVIGTLVALVHMYEDRFNRFLYF